MRLNQIFKGNFAWLEKNEVNLSIAFQKGKKTWFFSIRYCNIAFTLLYQITFVYIP